MGERPLTPNQFRMLLYINEGLNGHRHIGGGGSIGDINVVKSLERHGLVVNFAPTMWALTKDGKAILMRGAE